MRATACTVQNSGAFRFTRPPPSATFWPYSAGDMLCLFVWPRHWSRLPSLRPVHSPRIWTVRSTCRLQGSTASSLSITRAALLLAQGCPAPPSGCPASTRAATRSAALPCPTFGATAVADVPAPPAPRSPVLAPQDAPGAPIPTVASTVPQLPRPRGARSGRARTRSPDHRRGMRRPDRPTAKPDRFRAPGRRSIAVVSRRPPRRPLSPPNPPACPGRGLRPARGDRHPPDQQRNRPAIVCAPAADARRAPSRWPPPAPNNWQPE